MVRIFDELETGSLGTGIGFSWPKFTAYASNWDTYRASHLDDDRLLQDGFVATG